MMRVRAVAVVTLLVVVREPVVMTRVSTVLPGQIVAAVSRAAQRAFGVGAARAWTARQVVARPGSGHSVVPRTGGGVGVDAVRRRVGVGPAARQVVGGAARQVVARIAARQVVVAQAAGAGEVVAAGVDGGYVSARVDA
ncbi:hypothetical protein, partial [Streptomyces sp. IMTB 2501]|uniref:hypothetical protein n=1 Tax=Streptomyces sp. IMTB 2501 TaxID=1776340 RepID=UPI0015B7F96F